MTNAASHPELYVIQNPALHFKPEEAVSIVRYIVKDWKEKVDFRKKLSIVNTMYNEAVALGVIPMKNPLDGLEVT